MKDFIKFTFASLLGVLLAGIVFAILGIVSMVGMMASSDTETVVKENSIFMLKLNGTLSERASENPFQSFLGTDMYYARQHELSLRKKKIKDETECD